MNEPSTRSRRAMLGACGVGAAALAGCVGLVPGGFGGDCGFGYELSAAPATDEDFLEETLAGPPGEQATAWRTIVETAATEGEATYTTVHRAPVSDDARVEYDGTFYRVNREETSTRRVEAHLFTAEYDDGKHAPSDARAVAFEDLPAEDRVAFRELLPDLEERLGEVEGFSVGGYPYVYPDGAEEESTLLSDGPTWVRYRGADIRFSVDGTERVGEVTYRYTMGTIAFDRRGYLGWARDRFVVSPEFADGEREVLTRAIEAEDGIRLCEPEGAEAALVDRLESIPASKQPSYGVWFVELDGTVHLVELVEFAA